MADTPALTFLGIAGSLRAGSLNAAALRAATGLVPEGVSLKIASIADIPLHNGDVEAKGLPAPVQALRAEIEGRRRAAAVHAGIQLLHPGRAQERDRLGIPAARASVCRQADRHHGRQPRHARQGPIEISSEAGLDFMDGKLLNRPQVIIAGAMGKFDAQGNLMDQPNRQAIAALLVSLKAWTLQLARPIGRGPSAGAAGLSRRRA